MSDQIFWYLSRSSGLMSWLAAAGSMLVGTMIPSRLLGRRPTIPWLTDLHRMLGAMASVFLLIHMGMLWFDHFVAFRLPDLLIPFVADVPGLSRWSLALGVIAAWLLIAVELTSLVRERLPKRLWRSVHLTSYVILLLGTVHAVAAGSDIGNPIVAAIGTSALTAVILATVVRLRRLRQLGRNGAVPKPNTSPNPNPSAKADSRPSPDPVPSYLPRLEQPFETSEPLSPNPGETRHPAGHPRPGLWDFD